MRPHPELHYHHPPRPQSANPKTHGGVISRSKRKPIPLSPKKLTPTKLGRNSFYFPMATDVIRATTVSSYPTFVR